MRIRVHLYTKKLPILYRHRMMSLIKEALNISDSDYKEKLYPDKNSEKSKITKPFCFSLSMPASRIIKKERFIVDKYLEAEDTVFYFLPNNPLSLNISSPDYVFITNLYNGLLGLKEFKFDDDIMIKIGRIFMLREKKVIDDNIVLKTVSPILIESKDSKPILPIDVNKEIFNTHFNAIHDRILKDLRDGQGLYREINFIPVKLKKQVVKHTIKGFREKTRKPFMTLTCFEGCFKLEGDPKDLQMLYQVGIGLRTGQGFGMVEVV